MKRKQLPQIRVIEINQPSEKVLKNIANFLTGVTR